MKLPNVNPWPTLVVNGTPANGSSELLSVIVPAVTYPGPVAFLYSTVAENFAVAGSADGTPPVCTTRHCNDD